MRKRASRAATDVSPEAVERIVSATSLSMPAARIRYRMAREDGSKLEAVWLTRREYLRQRLHEIALWHNVEHRFQDRPRDRQAEDAFARVERAAQALLVALQSPGGDLDSMPGWMRSGALQAEAALDAERRGAKLATAGADTLREAVRGVESLRKWASTIAERKRLRRESHDKWAERADSKRPRHEGDLALKATLGDLCGLYEQVFERVAGTTSGIEDEGARVAAGGGPFVRFVVAALLAFGIRRQHSQVKEAIRHHLLGRKAVRKSKSARRKLPVTP